MESGDEIKIMETEYAKFRSYLDFKSFRFWNKGHHSKPSKWLENSKTHTVKGGNNRIISAQNCKTKTVHTRQNISKITKGTIVKCKSGKIDENNWMSPKKQF